VILYRECDEDRSSEATMGGGGGARSFDLKFSELKKMGARSARARTCGQNPLVYNCMIGYMSMCFCNQSYLSVRLVESMLCVCGGWGSVCECVR
jgi:hypothetical protein